MPTLGDSDANFRALRAGEIPRRVGESAVMRAFVELLDRVAAGNATVAIEGERGSGRRVAAERIHGRSARSQGPLIELNALAAAAAGDITEALDAATRAAAGGSLVVRFAATLGGPPADTHDARLLLLLGPGEADRSRFGPGLVSVRVPPLRTRRSDIPLLAEAFAEAHGQRAPGLSDGAVRRLVEHTWPGNVRELAAVVDLLALRHPGEMVDVEGLDAAILPSAVPLSLHALEQRHILGILAACDGNRAEAARLLGISPRTLYNRLRRYHGAVGAQDAVSPRPDEPT